ncbi:MAG TPA: glycosyltransferase family 4 protein [Gemmataceae bacterium]|nr:glycosyltransferase family 4 protein [Gemmataceae bacterium]
MNVCLVSQEYPPETARGGVGTQTWNKARWLAQRGHAVHVLSCAAAPVPETRTETRDGVTVHRMPPPGGEFPVYTTPAYWVGYSWAVLRELHRRTQDHAFDVVDFPEYGAEGFAYQLDRTPWNWLPVVVQLHGPLAMFVEQIGWPERGGEFHRVGTTMEGVSIRQADALMACSANIADLTARLHGVPRESIDVVHCGVDAGQFRLGAGGGDGRPTVLFVGNLAANKGVGVVLDAVLHLRAKYPAIRLRVVGKPEGGYADELRDRVRTAGAEVHVEFAGFVGCGDLPEFYRRADLFCSPAQYEGGVANVYLEAMACGRPVVASTAGGAPEAVTDGETGLLVPPDDVAAVVRAIDRLLADPALGRRMGEAGRRRVEEYFAMDRYIDRVLAVYDKAIGQSRRKWEQLGLPEGWRR